VPDLWSILTGVASLISLLISLADKFARWRKYLVPATWALGGFAVGRLSFSLGSGITEIASDPAGSAFLIIILVIIAVMVTIATSLLKKGEAYLAYALVLMLIVLVPQIITFYSKPQERASSYDYLELAEMKTKSGDFTGALRYLENAKRAAASDEHRKAIDEQIKVVAGRQLERIKNPGQ
jgi:cation transport ATPase